jgi:hypothetical protein
VRGANEVAEVEWKSFHSYVYTCAVSGCGGIEQLSEVGEGTKCLDRPSDFVL